MIRYFRTEFRGLRPTPLGQLMLLLVQGTAAMFLAWALIVLAVWAAG